MRKPDFTGWMLVSDMDGTLLTRDQRISSENSAAIAAFVEAGGAFTVASGRAERGILPYLPQLSVNRPIISSGGARIYDPASDRLLWEGTMPDEAREMAREFVSRFPHLGLEVFGSDGSYVVQENRESLEHRLKEKLLPGVYDIDEVTCGWNKLVATGPHHLLEEARDWLSGNAAYTPVFSEEVYLDILSSHISKGEALRRLRGMCAPAPLRVAAIGDNMNDLPLLRSADVAAAVEGAPESVAGLAQFAAPDNESHAVAAFIDYLGTLSDSLSVAGIGASRR